jgi:hypothetical protein
MRMDTRLNAVALKQATAMPGSLVLLASRNDDAKSAALGFALALGRAEQHFRKTLDSF